MSLSLKKSKTEDKKSGNTKKVKKITKIIIKKGGKNEEKEKIMNEKEKLVKENFNKNIDIHLKKLIRDNTVISNILPSEISNVIYLERFFNTEFTKTKDYSLNIFKQIEIDKHFKLDNIDWKYAILDYSEAGIIRIYKRNNITQNLDKIISYQRPYREKYFILEVETAKK